MNKKEKEALAPEAALAILESKIDIEYHVGPVLADKIRAACKGSKAKAKTKTSAEG